MNINWVDWLLVLITDLVNLVLPVTEIHEFISFWLFLVEADLLSRYIWLFRFHIILNIKLIFRGLSIKTRVPVDPNLRVGIVLIQHILHFNRVIHLLFKLVVVFSIADKRLFIPILQLHTIICREDSLIVFEHTPAMHITQAKDLALILGYLSLLCQVNVVPIVRYGFLKMLP